MATRQPSDSQLIAQLTSHQQKVIAGGLNGSTEQARADLADALLRGLPLAEFATLADALEPTEQEPPAQPTSELEVLLERAAATNCQIAPEHLAQLVGMPPAWRFLATGADGNTKHPISGNWNSGLHNLKPLEVISYGGVLGVGVHTGPISGGLLVIDFDSPEWDPGAGERAFESTFGRPASDLPTTPRNSSGKPGRYKVFLQLPRSAWQLPSANWKAPGITNPDDPTSQPKAPLEVLWCRAGGKSLNAVICGEHPQSTPEKRLHFHWLEGLSPAQVPVAEAPGWLTDGLAALHIAEMRGALAKLEARSQEAESSEGIRAWEHLSTGDRRKLQKLILKHCPNREGSGSGTHPDVMAVLLGTWREMGKDYAETERLLVDSGWEENNRWESGKTLTKELLSITTSDLHTEDGKVPIDFRTCIAKAQEIGNSTNGKLVWPKWALPPKDPLEGVDDLTRIIQKLNQSEGNGIQMALLEGEAVRLGVRPDRLYRLRLEELLGTTSRSRSPEEVAMTRRTDNPDGDVIDGVLRRKVTCLAGASNSGKTTLAAFLASRVLRGDPLAVGGTLHSTNPGKVLWLTSDCSDEAVEEEMALQGIKVADYPNQWRCADGATFNNMLAIIQDLQDFKPDLVVMDCLASMAVNNCSVADPAFSEPLRVLQRHNGKAWKRAAFVLLHHTTRDQPVRFSGGEQIKAAVEELWIYYDPLLAEKKKPGERMKPSVESAVRRLWFEKCRAGFRGKELVVSYEAMRNLWLLRPHTGAGLDPRAQLDQFFRNWRGDEWKTASEWEAELVRKDIKINERTLRRTLAALAKGGLLEMVERFHQPTGKDRPHYRGSEAVRRMAAETQEGTRNPAGENTVD
jgi:hypothetical protein